MEYFDYWPKRDVTIKGGMEAVKGSDLTGTIVVIFE